MFNLITIPKATVVVAKVTTVRLAFVVSFDCKGLAVVVLTFAAECVSRQETNDKCCVGFIVRTYCYHHSVPQSTNALHKLTSCRIARPLDTKDFSRLVFATKVFKMD